MVIEMAQEMNEVLGMVERAWIHDHGYDLVYRAADGEPLCGKCVQQNKELILKATREHFEDSRWSDKQWAIVGVESTAEYEEQQQCSNCYAMLGPEPELAQ